MSDIPPRLRVIDFETTGLAPTDRVIEEGICDVVKGDLAWFVERPCSQLFGAPDIPPEVRAVHHIDPAAIRDLAPWTVDDTAYAAHEMGVFAFAAHKWDFESQWLGDPKPLYAICTWKVALRAWPDAPSHSNQALRYWLEGQGMVPSLGDLAMPPHRAGPDAYVTAHLLAALLNFAKLRVSTMVGWTREPALYPRCPIGKFRGKPWYEVETGFLKWMLKQDDMEADLKWCADLELSHRGMPAS